MATLLHELMSHSANLCPESIAIQEKDRAISYQALDLNSTKIANLITQLGTEKGERIGLLTHKSIEAYTGLYAILKSGCAYVPMDRGAPAERLSYICDDCEIKTLIITSKAWSKVKQLTEKNQSIKTVIVLDTDEPQTLNGITVLSRVNFDSQKGTITHNLKIIASDMAYILFTSGSTGKPKGVVISHHIALSFVSWSKTHTELRSVDRVSGHAPLHFDLSVYDTFATAMAGATLLPVPDGTSTFPSRLLDWIISNKISVWYSVPSILSMMTESPNFEAGTCPSLRLVVFAGEVFPVKFLKKWMKFLPNSIFMNWFGPTETNVICSHTVTMTADEISTPIPIGRATSNAKLYCLDDNGEHINEIGKSGELFAGGACVALGYWGDEAQSNVKFLIDKKDIPVQDRVFKTGDIVSLNDKGEFVFHGRRDHLIKSRGYRIELGDVESAYYKQRIIKEVAVIAFPDELIGNKLIAFISIQLSSQLDNDDDSNDAEMTLREKAIIDSLVSEGLPTYMVPTETIILSALPKTSSGKIDRQKLFQLIHNKNT